MTEYLAPIFTNSALEKLPLFADDSAIAAAIVGTGKAAYFKTILPTLERNGFPRKCPLHGGRSTYLIKLFYMAYYMPERKTVEYRADAVRTEEHTREVEKNWEDFKRAQAEKKARKKANSDSWAERKRVALDQHRAKKAAAGNEIDTKDLA